jgi:site-specific recombinase XerD
MIGMNTQMVSHAKWETDIAKILDEASYIVPSSDSSFDELVLAYLDFCHTHKDMTNKSILHELRYTRYFFDWFAKQYDIKIVTRIQAAHIKEYLSSLDERELSNCSIRHHFVTLKYFFDYLSEVKILMPNPARGIRIKMVRAAPRQLISPEQRDSIQDAPPVGSTLFRRTRSSAVMALLFSTGMRLQEISGLKIEDIDFADKTIHISGKGGRTVSHKFRTGFLDDAALSALKQYLPSRPVANSPWLFTDAKGFRLKSPVYQAIVHSYGIAAKVSIPLNFQVLRASFASWMVEAGVDPVALKQLMGHKDIRTTFKCYVSMTEAHIRTTWLSTNPLSRLLSGEVVK